MLMPYSLSRASTGSRDPITPRSARKKSSTQPAKRIRRAVGRASSSCLDETRVLARSRRPRQMVTARCTGGVVQYPRARAMPASAEMTGLQTAPIMGCAIAAAHCALFEPGIMPGARRWPPTIRYNFCTNAAVRIPAFAGMTPEFIHHPTRAPGPAGRGTVPAAPRCRGRRPQRALAPPADRMPARLQSRRTPSPARCRRGSPPAARPD